MSVSGERKDGISVESTNAPASSSSSQPEELERKARVDAVWEQMNKGVSSKTLKSITNKPCVAATKTTQKTTLHKNSSSWMTYLGLAPKNTAPLSAIKQDEQPNHVKNGTSDEAKRLAAAALSAVKDAAAQAAASALMGRVEIREVRDFAGQEIEVKKLVDANSEKAKVPAGTPAAIDVVLEQIKKKQKLSVLDKTKKDWGEYKEENKGMEEELEAYKKSSNQYLDKVSFLQRADFREFERERDARLAMQAKRKPDMREDP
ncbi:hypothetical protein NMG60_11024936 [Bertholletia excelsa]